MSQGPADRKVVGLVPRMAISVVEAQRRLDEAFAADARRAAVDAAVFKEQVGLGLASLLMPPRIDLGSTTIESGCQVATTRFVEGSLSLTLFGRPATQFLSARYEEEYEAGARVSLTVDVERSLKAHPKKET